MIDDPPKLNWITEEFDTWLAERTKRLLGWRGRACSIIGGSALLVRLEWPQLKEVVDALNAPLLPKEHLPTDPSIWLNQARVVMNVITGLAQPEHVSPVDAAHAASELLRGWLLSLLTSRFGYAFGQVLKERERTAKESFVRYVRRIGFANVRWFACWEDALHIAMLDHYRTGGRPLLLPLPSLARDARFYERIGAILHESSIVYEHPLKNLDLANLLDLKAVGNPLQQTLKKVYDNLERFANDATSDTHLTLEKLHRLSQVGIDEVEQIMIDRVR